MACALKIIQTEQDAATNELNEQLRNAVAKFDVELIKQGANPKHVHLMGNKSDWYEGDSTSPLYICLKKFGRSDAAGGKRDALAFVAVAVLLLANGANPTFSAQSGNWNRSSKYPITGHLPDCLSRLPDLATKKELLLAFAGAGVELNQRISEGKQKNSYGFGSTDYSIFDMVNKVGEGGDGANNGDALALVSIYVECGIDVNCAQNYWEMNCESDNGEWGRGRAKRVRKTAGSNWL